MVRPFDLAADTLGFVAAHIGALLLIVILPAILRVGIFIAHEAVARGLELAWRLPDWVMNLASYGISAIVFTGIIRYVVLAEGPFWLPNRSWLRNYLTTAAVLMVVASTISFVTGSWLIVNFYGTFIAETPYDEGRFLQLYAIYLVAGFFISAVLIAGIYPIFALTAVQDGIDVRRLLRWDRKYYWRFLILSLLLMSVCLVLSKAYWWVLNTFAPGLTTDTYYAEHKNVRTLVEQLTYVPMDILFDIIPPVAIGLLYRVLRVNSADL